MYEVKFNTKFHRWEVYRENGVIMNGEVQPVFVSALVFDAWEYVKRCENG